MNKGLAHVQNVGQGLARIVAGADRIVAVARRPVIDARQAVELVVAVGRRVTVQVGGGVQATVGIVRVLDGVIQEVCDGDEAAACWILSEGERAAAGMIAHGHQLEERAVGQGRRVAGGIGYFDELAIAAECPGRLVLTGRGVGAVRVPHKGCVDRGGRRI